MGYQDQWNSTGKQNFINSIIGNGIKLTAPTLAPNIFAGGVNVGSSALANPGGTFVTINADGTITPSVNTVNTVQQPTRQTISPAMSAQQGANINASLSPVEQSVQKMRDDYTKYLSGQAQLQGNQLQTYYSGRGIGGSGEEAAALGANNQSLYNAQAQNALTFDQYANDMKNQAYGLEVAKYFGFDNPTAFQMWLEYLPEDQKATITKQLANMGKGLPSTPSASTQSTYKEVPRIVVNKTIGNADELSDSNITETKTQTKAQMKLLYPNMTDYEISNLINQAWPKAQGNDWTKLFADELNRLLKLNYGGTV